MGLVNEYIQRNLSAQELQEELKKLITQYNKLKSTYLLVHAAAIGKPVPPPLISLNVDDYYIIFDMLRKVTLKNLDYYIETPGGSADVVAEIVRFIRSKFEQVSFVVSGQAKSAGTILVLSGDEILMSESGSLGPIDAQIQIGRSQISAYDYMEWINAKRKEAEENKKLNPLDATMVAQISPGEIGLVDHALRFAEDLVVEWLPKYKFRNWDTTETRKISVTPEMKRERAAEIAKKLMDRTKWRTHGRSIKIAELEEEIGLKITKLDKLPDIADLIYRIQTVIRLLLSSTDIYKIIATADERLIYQALSTRAAPKIKIPKLPPGAQAEVGELEVKCSKCGKPHKLYAKFVEKPGLDNEMQKKGFIPFPKDNKLKCSCGFEHNLIGLRNSIEMKTHRKIIS
jgi:hypothetical protein